MKEKYIITFEDGEHFIAEKLEKSDYNQAYEGLLTIIRVTDMTQYNPNEKTWDKLLEWESDGE